MILRALYDYYNRKQTYEPDSLPSYGLMDAAISFIIVIKEDGSFVRIEETRDEKGKGIVRRVPKGTHTNAETPRLFWDNCQYAIDYSSENKNLSEDDLKKPNWLNSAAHKKHLAFIKRCQDVARCSHDKDLEAVVLFYSSEQLKHLKDDSYWKELEKNPEVNVTFMIQGATSTIAENPILLNYIEKDSDQQGVCLITGKRTDIVRKSTPTPVRGCKNSASLVSFQKDSGYDSYGKTQAYNAPISIEAEFAYAAAFNKMKQKGSHNNFTIADRIYLFWSSSNNAASLAIEESVFSMFGISDNPDAKTENIKRAFMSVFNGKYPSRSNDTFFVAGIAPNAGREAIVYYEEVQLRVFAKKVLQHFVDMDIVKSNKVAYVNIGVYEILRAVVLNGDITKNCPSNLIDAVVKSIFQGLPYPESLYQACIRRIRAESSTEIPLSTQTMRAAIIKAYLNRLNNNYNKKLDIMLDKENKNQGYLCGRLFAVLDKIQEDANSVHTIRERYMNSASATPATVFATILNLSAHHLEKMNKSSQIHYEKLKQEIISKLDAEGFPTHLDLQDQGRFFVGYYHQRQEFFTSSEN